MPLFLVSTIFFVSITITPTYSQSSGNNLPNIFVTTPEAAAPHQIPLKAIKQGSEISQVSAFNIDFTNVVQLPQNGSVIIISTAQDSSFQIKNTRLKDTSNAIIDLPKTAQNTFTLQGIPTGVYTLDVIGQQGNVQGAYETILIILPPNQPISEQTENVVKQRIAYEIVNVGSIFIDRPDDPLCDFDSGHKIIDGECIDLRDDEGREIRGRGTASDGSYNIDNCTGQDCADADKETEQERSGDDLPEYVPPSEDEDIPPIEPCARCGLYDDEDDEEEELEQDNEQQDEEDSNDDHGSDGNDSMFD